MLTKFETINSKILSLFDQVQEKVILCIENIYQKLDKTDITDEILPMLAKCNLSNPTVLMSVTSKFYYSFFLFFIENSQNFVNEISFA